MEYKHMCALESNKNYYFLHRSELINISAKNPRTKLFFRSIASIRKEKLRHTTSKYSFIIHPLSIFRFYWELCVCVAIYISLFLIGGDLIDDPHLYASNVYEVIEIIIDFICIIDVILSLVSGICNEALFEVVTIPKKIIQFHLKKPGFYFNVIATIPDPVTNHFYMFILSHEAPQVPLIAASTHPIMKLLRIFKFLEYYRNVSLAMPNRYFPMFIKLFLLFILLMHWFTCIFLYVMMFDTIFYPELKVTIHDYHGITFEGHTDLTTYVRGLFIVTSYIFSLNLMVPYRKTLTYEYTELANNLLLIVMGTAGFITCTVITLYLMQILIDQNESHRKYHLIISQLEQYFSKKELPRDIRDRILTYYEYRFRKTYFKENHIVSMLSDTLQRDIYIHTCRTLIENVTVLKDLPQDIIANVVASLSHEIYLYSDIIMKAGAIGDCMYFIANGSVAVITPTGKEICHLQDGAYFGEIALITKDHKRTATVVAIEICEVYRLERKDFRHCFPANSLHFKKIEQIAHERMEKTSLLEELHRKYILTKTKRKIYT